MFESIELKLDKYDEWGNYLSNYIHDKISNDKSIELIIETLQKDDVAFIDKMIIINRLTSNTLF
jgi:hypothetical protein